MRLTSKLWLLRVTKVIKLAYSILNLRSARSLIEKAFTYWK